MSTPYNRNYQPPFPALLTYLRNGDERSGPFLALLDTGADVTFVPIDLLQEIEALEALGAQVRSHFGELRPVQLYIVGFQIENVTLGSTYVIGDEVGDAIILGRDVLNKLPVFLDGMQAQTDLLDDAAVQRLRSRRKL
jgi:hypothetical protein